MLTLEMQSKSRKIIVCVSELKHFLMITIDYCMYMDFKQSLVKIRLENKDGKKRRNIK